MKMKKVTQKNPSTHKEPLTQEKKKLLRRVIVLLIVFVLLLIAVAAVRFAWNHTKSPLEQEYLAAANEPLPAYSYIFEPDFEEDIFQDETYLRRDRDMIFTSGAQTVRVALDDTEHVFVEDITFFQQYFSAVVHGDYETYLSFFDDSYANNEDNMRLPTEPFTMQKIYDISVEMKSSSYNENGIQEAYYLVSYKFQDNNGTFRNDVRDGQIRPLAFQVCFYNDGPLITQIRPHISIVVS